MNRSQETLVSEDVLRAAKKQRQERSRARVKSGERTQESMFLIAPEIAQKIKVTHRVLSFD